MRSYDWLCNLYHPYHETVWDERPYHEIGPHRTAGVCVSHVSVSVSDLETACAQSAVMLMLRRCLCLSPQLKQKTVELSRGCQKHYALEQELAFLKIDAKFEPIPFYPEQVSLIQDRYVRPWPGDFD